MIGLDTNVLVRYIMQDNPEQSSKANQLIENLTKDKRAYFSHITLVEIIWVLESCYELDKNDVIKVIDGILRSRELCTENSEVLWRAFRLFQQSNADFSDCLISVTGLKDGCKKTYTFDKKAAKLSGMELLQ